MSSSYGNNDQGYTLANLDDADLGSNQAGQVLPIFWGIREMTPHFITPLWNSIVTPIRTKYEAGGIFGSKGQDVTTGYDRSASICAALCVGPVDSLVKIRFNDDDAWTGDLSSSTADLRGMTSISTTSGIIRLYWGKANQLPDEVLLANWPDMTAYPHFVYFVAPQFYFGQSTSPPNVRFTFKRKPKSHPGGAFIGQDAALPEVLYDVLTDPVYGMGIDPARVNKDSFDAAATRNRNEGLGYSPYLNNGMDLREFVATCTGLVRGCLIWKAGQLFLKLNRDEDLVTTTITMDQLMDEPTVKRGGWADTFCETQLTFPNNKLNFEDDFVAYRDPANFNITGTYTRQETSHDWVTEKSVAMAIVKMEGQKAAIPAGTLQMNLTNECRRLEPGDVLSITYPPLSITAARARIVTVQVGNPKDPTIQVEASIDRMNVNTTPYVPTPDPYVPPSIPVTQDILLRIGWLPSVLKGDKYGGFFACAARPNNYTANAIISLSIDGNNFNQLGSNLVGMAMNVLKWRTYGARAILRVLLVSASTDEEILVSAVSNYRELRFVCGLIKDGLEVPTCGWLRYPFGGYIAKVGLKTWDIEVESGLNETDPLAIANPRTGTASVTPGLWMFGGSKAAAIYLSDDIVFETPGAVRQVRAQAVTLYEVQALADAAQAVSNASSVPSKFVPSWGTIVSPTANHEYVRQVLAQSAAYWRMNANFANLLEAAHDGSNSGGTIQSTGAIMGATGSALLPAGSWVDFGDWAGAVLSNNGFADCWFKSDSASTAYRSIFAKLGDWAIVAKGGFFGFVDHAANEFRLSTVAVDDQWHYLALRLSGTGLTRSATLFVDGSTAAEGSCVALTGGDVVAGFTGQTIAGEADGGAMGAIAEASVGPAGSPEERYYAGTNIWWD